MMSWFLLSPGHHQAHYWLYMMDNSLSSANLNNLGHISIKELNHIDGLVQDFSIASVLAMKILQSFTKPSICKYYICIFSQTLQTVWYMRVACFCFLFQHFSLFSHLYTFDIIFFLLYCDACELPSGFTQGICVIHVHIPALLLPGWAASLLLYLNHFISMG